MKEIGEKLREARKQIGISLDEASIKRSGVNYIDKLDYVVYENFDDFKSKNIGTYYYFTRYGKKPHTSFDYSNKDENIYLIFGKESTGIPKEILKDNLDRCTRIPCSDNIRCFNVSNSVAMALYEVMRQQNYHDLCKYEPFKGEDYLTRE